MRSVQLCRRDNDEYISDDELNDIVNRLSLPELSTVKREEDKIYQNLMPIDNGIYDGTVNEELLREGQGIYRSDNSEEFYSGSWKNNKPHGYGYSFKSQGRSIYHGEFENGELKEGYGKVGLEHKYEYEGKIVKGKFHDLGSLSIKIEGLIEIDSPGVEKDTLKLVAEWEKGKTRCIYVNGIEKYYQYQYKVFSDSLDSIISLDNENRQKQRQYFRSLIDLSEKRLLNITLLKEIAKHPMLPGQLKLSADLLSRIDNSYTKLETYTKIQIKKSYNDCVKDFCRTGLKIYASQLAWSEDNDKFHCISSKEVFAESLNNLRNQTEISDLKKVLFLNPLVIDSIRKMIRFANDRLIHISSQYQSEFIQHHTTRSDDENNDKYHFYTDCYSNLLELPFISQSEVGAEQNLSFKLKEDVLVAENNIGKEITSIVFDAMMFSLDNLKPWKEFQVEKWSSYFNESINRDISIKNLGDKLLIKIFYDAKNKLRSFLKMNRNIEDTNEFFSHLESIVNYYQSSLSKDENLNYQSKMKEIKKILDYFLQISKNRNSQHTDIINLQLESIKAFIEGKESVTNIIDRFLNYNMEFYKLSENFNRRFPPNISPFSKNASDILSSIKMIFPMILKEEDMTDPFEEPERFNVSNKIEKKLYAMQKINNFLTNLESLDFTWFVEFEEITNFNFNLFEQVGGKNFFKVLNIDEAKAYIKVPYHHYVLDAIKQLLDIIQNVSLIHPVSSTDMIEIRAELIMAIGKSFKYFSDQIKYNSLQKFQEDCVIPFQDVTKDIESCKIFCDKLEKIDLYFLYNRKLKEIDLKEALRLFQVKNEALYEIQAIRDGFLKYKKLFNTYFNDVIKKEISIEDITKKTKEIAKTWNFRKEPIPDIIAGLSVILSLSTSDFIEKRNNKYQLKNKYNETYLLQPHCIQILGVLMLLNIDEEGKSIPPNHLAEILTGQGKSWALALLAGFFSLTSYQVTVGCYSNYLSKRDKSDFEKNLAPFNFTNDVNYTTFESMCNKKLSSKKSNKNVGDIIADIVSGKELSPSYSEGNEKQKSILLIDEVDVFFSHEFGTVYRPAVNVTNRNVAEVQKDI
ncbi:unnamed protein product [Didymodactylos carnosus]|uniref:Uncharacterized protein n=1 Tax=Didymodactylos carnosus TaxID=1234261 RepID=A0A814V3T7_9BILA|nr:unnamed protein product [Didymodactylos carnosus]CAF3944594.1 unnamed protein product [Didymodactylos carnosus]